MNRRGIANLFFILAFVLIGSYFVINSFNNESLVNGGYGNEEDISGDFNKEKALEVISCSSTGNFNNCIRDSWKYKYGGAYAKAKVYLYWSENYVNNIKKGMTRYNFIVNGYVEIKYKCDGDKTYLSNKPLQCDKRGCEDSKRISNEGTLKITENKEYYLSCFDYDYDKEKYDLGGYDKAYAYGWIDTYFNYEKLDFVDCVPLEPFGNYILKSNIPTYSTSNSGCDEGQYCKSTGDKNYMYKCVDEIDCSKDNLEYCDIGECLKKGFFWEYTKCSLTCVSNVQCENGFECLDGSCSEIKEEPKEEEKIIVPEVKEEPKEEVKKDPKEKLIPESVAKEEFEAEQQGEEIKEVSFFDRVLIWFNNLFSDLGGK